MISWQFWSNLKLVHVRVFLQFILYWGFSHDAGRWVVEVGLVQVDGGSGAGSPIFQGCGVFCGGVIIVFVLLETWTVSFAQAVI